jgi:hypothetical protein
MDVEMLVTTENKLFFIFLYFFWILQKTFSATRAQIIGNVGKN